MRMWMLNPILLCNNHLLGCHLEIHKFRHIFEKHHSISGRLKPIVQIEPLKMKERHDELVKEMLARGFKHNSPYEQPDLSFYGDEVNVHVNLEFNLIDLKNRCEKCRERIEMYYDKSF